MATLPNGPMGSGIDIDIETRKPVVPKSLNEIASAAKTKMEEAVFRAISLQADLSKSPVLELLLQQFTNRMDALAKQDPVCATLLAVLVNIRSTIDIVPQYAHKRFKDMLGASVTVPPAVMPDPAAQAIPESE
jgi:hypothetical protein